MKMQAASNIISFIFLFINLDSIFCYTTDNAASTPQNVIIEEVDRGSWLLTWKPLEGAAAYKTTIYLTNHIKYKEEGPIYIPFAEIKELDPTKEYFVTVAAIHYTNMGVVEGPESEPLLINRVSCPNNQVYLPCTSHCVSTCENPEQIPICNRMCVPGCGCPREFPTLKNGFCIKPFHCPMVARSVENPTNLRVVSAEETQIILTWDPVKGAKDYKVQVFLSINKHFAIHTQYVPYPIAEVTGLQPDTAYIFRVTAVRGRTEALRSSRNDPIKTNFEGRSLKVGWETDEDARRYGVVLYEEASQNGKIDVVMKDDNIATPEVELEGLKPSTTYTIEIASAKAGEDLKAEVAVSKFTTPSVVDDQEVFDGEDGVFVTKTMPRRIKTTARTTTKATTTMRQITTAKTTTRTPTTLKPTTTRSITTSKASTTTEATTTEATASTTTEQVTTKEVTSSAATTTSTAAELTNCQKEAISKINSEEEIFDCRSDGNYVTVRCNDVTTDDVIPKDCWCVDAVDGVKLEGSDFSMKFLQSNSILLNCDKYGTFDASDRELFIRQVFTEKITLGWGSTQDEKTDEIHTVLVRVYDDSGLTKMLITAFGDDFAVDGLRPNTQYKITVQAINTEGASTAAGWSTELEFETLTLEKMAKPTNVKFLDARHKLEPQTDGSYKPEFALSWDAVDHAVYYRVRAINIGNVDKPTTTVTVKVTDDIVVLTSLSPLVPYTIEISAHGTSGGSDVTTVTVERLCTSHPLDLVFAIDVSWHGNLNWINFHYKKEAAAKVAAKLQNTTRLAFVKYYRDSIRVADFETWSYNNGTLNTKKAYNGFKNVKWNGTRTLELSSVFEKGNGMFELLSPDYNEDKYALREDAIPVVVYLVGAAPEKGSWDEAEFDRKSKLMYDNAHVVVVGSSLKISKQDVRKMSSNIDHAVWLNKKLSSMSNRHINYDDEADAHLSKLLCLPKTV